MFCPNCGAQVPDGSAFCGSCGARLGGAPQAPQQSVYQQAPQQTAKPKKKISKGKVALIAVAAVAVVAVLGMLVNYFAGVGYRRIVDTNTQDAAALGLRVEPQKLYDKDGTVVYALGALGVYDWLGDVRYNIDLDVENHSFFEKGFIARNVSVNGIAVPPEDEIYSVIVHGKASSADYPGDGLMLSVEGLAKLNIAQIETITFQIEMHTYWFNSEVGKSKLTEPMTIYMS